MFRSKRNALVRRLWKLRVTSDETSCPLESQEDLEVKSAVQAMLKRLKDVQLERLLGAVETQGADPSGCVLVPRGDLRLMGRRAATSAAPHVLCCQLWRWTDLRHAFELKRLHWCQAANDPLYVCCNPYHWSRLYKPESPPPPYTRLPQEMYTSLENSPREPVSTETGNPEEYASAYGQRLGFGSGTSASQIAPAWCTLAYWELRSRVGRLFPVHQGALNVFSHLPQGEGLCLSTLAQTHTASDTVQRVRDKIGLGLTLSQENQAVWLYNRSRFPVFLDSPTLDQPQCRTLTVYKVLPGYSLKIFDYEKARQYQKLPPHPELLENGPFDPNSVRISFVKGWGPKYSRQAILSCPCWLEVLLAVPPR